MRVCVGGALADLEKRQIDASGILEVATSIEDTVRGQASEQESEEAPDLRIRADDDRARRSAVHDDVLEGQ